MIGAIAGPLLVQVPPAVASLRIVVAPTQMLDRPVILAGLVLTVTGDVVVHPASEVNVIVVVPVARPVKLPLTASMVPVTGTLLIQVPPPEVASVRRMLDPWHTWLGPPMLAGNGLTETIREEEQPPTV